MKEGREAGELSKLVTPFRCSYSANTGDKRPFRKTQRVYARVAYRILSNFITHALKKEQIKRNFFIYCWRIHTHTPPISRVCSLCAIEFNTFHHLAPTVRFNINRHERRSKISSPREGNSRIILCPIRVAISKAPGRAIGIMEIGVYIRFITFRANRSSKSFITSTNIK